MLRLFGCLLGNQKTIDNNIEKKINKNYTNDLNKEIESIQTSVITDTTSKRKKSKTQDTLLEINEFDKCKYWFNEILKYSVNDYEGYDGNKKELCEHTFKFVDLNKTLQYYKRYNKDYNNFNTNNIKKFINNKDNTDFIQDIRISENIYRFY
jgi:transcription antitermination factor NusG